MTGHRPWSTIKHKRQEVSAPPKPLVERKGHTVRWSGQTILRLFWAFVLGHIFGYMWIALYYIVTQNHVVKPVWDNTLVPWDLLRHFLRDYIEALLATTAVWFALFSRWSKQYRKPITLPERVFDRIGMPSRAQQEPTKGWQYWLSLPMTVLASFPGAAVAFVVLFLLDHYEKVMRGAVFSHSLAAAHPSLVEKYFTTIKSDVPIKIAGILGGLFFARVVFTKIASDGQRAFIRRRVAKYVTQGRFRRFFAKPRWPLPAPYRAEFNIEVKQQRVQRDVQGVEAITPTRHDRLVRTIQILGMLAVLFLAYYGWTVMTTVAVHKPGPSWVHL